MIKIRQALVDDAKNIVEVNVKTWKVAYKSLLPDEFLLGRNVSEERILAVANRIKDLDSIYFVAEYGENVVGFCCAGLPRDKGYPFEYEIRALYVLPSYQKKGIGTALINEFNKTINNKSFYLYTLKQNISAHNFYIRHNGVELPEYEKKLLKENFEIIEVLFAFNYK